MATDADFAQLLNAIKALTAKVAALEALVTGEPVPDPVKPVDPAKPPVVVTPPAPPVMEPLDLKALILSIIGMVVAPATGVSEPVGSGTLGSLLPYIIGGLSGVGLPSLAWNWFKGKLKS